MTSECRLFIQYRCSLCGRQTASGSKLIEQDLALSASRFDAARACTHHHFVGEDITGTSALPNPDEESLRYRSSEKCFCIRFWQEIANSPPRDLPFPMGSDEDASLLGQQVVVT